MPLLLTSEFGSNSQRGMSGLYVINKQMIKMCPELEERKALAKWANNFNRKTDGKRNL